MANLAAERLRNSLPVREERRIVIVEQEIKYSKLHRFNIVMGFS